MFAGCQFRGQAFTVEAQLSKSNRVHIWTKKYGFETTWSTGQVVSTPTVCTHTLEKLGGGKKERQVGSDYENFECCRGRVIVTLHLGTEIHNDEKKSNT
jgi:hypothetical protein